MNEHRGKLFWAAAIFVTACAGLLGGNWLRERQDIGIEPQNTAEMFAGTYASSDDAGFSQPPSGSYFDDVRRLIENDYVDRDLDETKMARGAAQYLLQELGDPATRFYDPEEWKAYTGMFEGQYSGIGADLAIRPEKSPQGIIYPVRVVSVADGGPAAKAGLRSGDWVDEVNGKWVASRSLIRDWQIANNKFDSKQITREEFDSVFESLRKRSENMTTAFTALDELAVKSGPVRLKIRRGDQTIEVSLNREAYRVAPVELVGDIIRIRSFSNNARSELSKLLEGKQEVKLDIRGNPGGRLANVLSCLALFLPPGEFAKVESRPDRPLQSLSLKTGAPNTYKVTVLVDSGTAREAELFAAALRDRIGATVEGTMCGLGQRTEWYSLADGSGYTVTSGRFKDLAGKSLYTALDPVPMHAKKAAEGVDGKR
jgi:carboxyl-terminal processing protease